MFFCFVLQPDEIWKEIAGNQEFTERATANFRHTLEFSLKTQQRKCIRRLYQLIVDLKSKQNSKNNDMVASQILWQLLQVKRFDPREVRSFICSLWNVVGVNQILQQGSMVMRELHLCLGVFSNVECYVVYYGNQVHCMIYLQGADQVALYSRGEIECSISLKMLSQMQKNSAQGHAMVHWVTFIVHCHMSFVQFHWVTHKTIVVPLLLLVQIPRFLNNKVLALHV